MRAVGSAGRNTASVKYDILTALGAYALGQGGHAERLTLRLMTLIVARYNWQTQQLAIGQREIARLWSVDERTVKREMAKLRGLGWLRVTRQGARGRVTEYRLEIETVFEQTRGIWDSIGPDYAARMSERDSRVEDNVVPLSIRSASGPAPKLNSGDEWSLAAALVYAEDAALYNSWLRTLIREGRDGGRLRLRAPSRFHASYVSIHLEARLLEALRSVDDRVTAVQIGY